MKIKATSNKQNKEMIQIWDEKWLKLKGGIEQVCSNLVF